MKRFEFTKDVECTIWERRTYVVEAACVSSARKKLEDDEWEYHEGDETLYDTMESTGNEEGFELEYSEKID